MSLHLRFLLGFLCCLSFASIAKASAEVQLAAGTLETLSAIPFKGITERTVQVWLPPSYPSQAPYAVLYQWRVKHRTSSAGM